jgi:hypothetical protein
MRLHNWWGDKRAIEKNYIQLNVSPNSTKVVLGLVADRIRLLPGAERRVVRGCEARRT